MNLQNLDKSVFGKISENRQFLISPQLRAFGNLGLYLFFFGFQRSHLKRATMMAKENFILGPAPPSMDLSALGETWFHHWIPYVAPVTAVPSNGPGDKPLLTNVPLDWVSASDRLAIRSSHHGSPSRQTKILQSQIWFSISQSRPCLEPLEDGWILRSICTFCVFYFRSIFALSLF